MQNHTATHLLNEALNSLLPLTAQQSSHVGPNDFTFRFSAFNTEVDVDFVTKVEEAVHKYVDFES